MNSSPKMMLVSFVFMLVYCTRGAYFAMSTCGLDTAEWYKYNLATKTPYRIVANTSAKKSDFKDCRAKKIWMMVRHGTRNPGHDKLQELQTDLPRIRDLILQNNSDPSVLLRYSDLYNLAQWKNEIPFSDASILRDEGQMEGLELAERMQIRFPELFPSTYSNQTYFFKVTRKQRTQAMAKFFAAGLFGRDKVDEVFFPPPLDTDPILEFYKLCERWKYEVDKNPEAVREKTLFEQSPYMAKIIKRINTALNLPEDALSLDNIATMYDACRFETAWNEVRKSPWCSIFDAQSLKAMEFLEDLQYYYVEGYGHELNYKQACLTFGDMFTFLTGSTNRPQTVVYFSHSGALMKLIAHTGLYKDKNHLKHSDYEANKRQWKTSSIGSFGTTLAFVLFECKKSPRIAVYHQEQLVELPACKEELCTIDEISKYYRNSIKQCDFEDMCRL